MWWVKLAAANNSLQPMFDSLLDLATPSPHIGSNAAELRRYESQGSSVLMRKPGSDEGF